MPAMDNPDNEPGYFHEKDVYYFADWLSDPSNVKPINESDLYASNIRSYAQNVKKYLTDGTSSQKCVYHVKVGASYDNSKGLSIYLPEGTTRWERDKNNYNNLNFPMGTEWDEMLDVAWPSV
jgi:hypothetical protein